MKRLEMQLKMSSLTKDNALCNTKASKLLELVDGLVDALNSASECIGGHERNDRVLHSEKLHIDNVIEDTYERLSNL